MFGFDDLILGGLAFGGSLLSGLGAKKSAAKQQRLAIMLQAQADAHNQAVGQQMLARYAPSQIPKDAYAAGYNPVTWLGAMGGSYGALWQQGWSMQTQGVAPTINVPSTMQAVGGALSSLGSTMTNITNNNRNVDARNYATQMQGWIAEVQSERSRGNMLAGLGTPFFEVAGKSPVSKATGGAGAADALGSEKNPYAWDPINAYGYGVDKPTYNRSGLFGRDPSQPDASGLVGSIPQMVSDAYYGIEGSNLNADWARMRNPDFRTEGARAEWDRRNPPDWTEYGFLTPPWLGRPKELPFKAPSYDALGNATGF